MATIFGRTWWGLLLRGLLSILFGIAVFVWPGLSLLALITLFGAFALVDGVLGVINGIRLHGEHNRWWAVLLEGLLGVAVGLMALVFPGQTTVALLYVIAAWAIVTGVLEIISAIRYADVMEHEWLLGLAGLASIVLGVLLAIFPEAGLSALLLMIGAYAIVFGVLMVIAGIRARTARGETTTYQAA